MSRPDAVLRDRSTTGQVRGWVHRHPCLNEHGEVVWAAAWYASPDDAVEAAKRCASGCSPECARARRAGHHGYVAQATA